ncbi:MAG: peroxiredoxin [Bryobacteraceae bacterium]|nr:peroxiredoxin [Bryobacteraceae bacterium]
MFSLFSGPPLAPGTEAPDFTLPDQDGKKVSLRALRGRNVVLVFYPGDDTPVCRKQLCEFRDQAKVWQAKNTVVFGVNPGGAKSHAGFREKNHLGFPLLVDDGGRVADAYRCKGLFMTSRTVYLIGPDGKIRYAKRGKPDPAEVLAAAV